MRDDDMRPRRNWLDEERRWIGRLKSDATAAHVRAERESDEAAKKAALARFDLIEREEERLVKARRTGTPYRVQRLHLLAEATGAVAGPLYVKPAAEIDMEGLGHGRDE